MLLNAARCPSSRACHFGICLEICKQIAIFIQHLSALFYERLGLIVSHFGCTVGVGKIAARQFDKTAGRLKPSERIFCVLYILQGAPDLIIACR